MVKEELQKTAEKKLQGKIKKVMKKKEEKKENQCHQENPILKPPSEKSFRKEAVIKSAMQ